MSDHTAPMPPPPTGSDAVGPTKKPWWKRWWGIALIALLALILIVSLTGGDEEPEIDEQPVADEPAAVEEPAVEEEPEPAPEPEPEPEAEAEAPPEEPEPEEPATEEPEVTGVGSPARDGAFEFTVNGLECGAASVGDEIFAEEAQGQYCLLEVTVENIGDAAGTLFPDNLYLLNDEGVEYSADSAATFANDPEGGFLTEINPGNSSDGVVVFDVPEDAGITSARLHDSAFSGGVEVDLTG